MCLAQIRAVGPPPSIPHTAPALHTQREGEGRSRMSDAPRALQRLVNSNMRTRADDVCAAENDVRTASRAVAEGREKPPPLPNGAGKTAMGGHTPSLALSLARGLPAGFLLVTLSTLPCHPLCAWPRWVRVSVPVARSPTHAALAPLSFPMCCSPDTKDAHLMLPISLFHLSLTSMLW